VAEKSEQGDEVTVGLVVLQQCERMLQTAVVVSEFLIPLAYTTELRQQRAAGCDQHALV
jgi:hypothetical protein